MGGEFSLVFSRGGGGNPPNLGPATSQAYLGTRSPWRLARPGKIRVLRYKGVFLIFKLIARYSKYDFWIPGEILGLGKKSRKKILKIYFSKIKNQNFRKVEKSKTFKKNENPKMSKFSTFSTFQHFRKFQKNLTSEQNFRHFQLSKFSFPPPRKYDGCDY